MLSFDPRALLTPGGIINGAGNAIAALAGVPARYQHAQEEKRRNDLALQALTQKGQFADREFGLKQQAQDWTQDPTNPANANSLTFEQRKQLAEIRASAGQGKPASPFHAGTPVAGALPTMINQQTGESWVYSPRGQQWIKMGGGPQLPQAGAPAAPQGSPAVQALAQPGGAPVVPGAMGTPAASPEQKLSRLAELNAKPNLSDAEADEMQRLLDEVDPQPAKP